MSDTGEPIPGATPVEVSVPKFQVAVATSTPSEAKLDTEAVKKELIDPRTISRTINPEGRTEITRAVIAVRTETQTTQAGLTDREQKIQQIAELTSASYQREQQKSQELAQRMESLVVKMKGIVGIGDKQVSGLQAEIAAIKQEQGELYAQSWAIENELAGLRQKQTEIPKPRELLDAYYEKMSTQPLSNEQKRDLLKPEVLASLNDEEYAALWRRLNPHFLSHVTRQGFRDHNAMVYHSTGLQEFHNGFLGVVEDDKQLRPPLALHGLRTRDEASVKDYLSSWVLQAKDQDEAKSRLHSLLNFHLASAPKYPDETAVHFAAQLVANDYYGGESSNEVFFIYPSDVLASQHNFAFNGWEKDFTKPQSETKWNDVFIWPSTLDNPGVPVDAGIVFLPETTPVDPATGSKYASEVKVVDGKEKRVMIEDSTLVSSFVDWGKKLDDQSPFKKAFVSYKEERNYFRQQDLRDDCFTACAAELQGLGFNPDASAALADKMLGEMYYRDSFDVEVLEAAVRGTGASWKRAENTIPAKDYWEGFFAKNPNLRPKHIQYYDGSPTSAVYEFLQKNNIGRADTSKTDGNLLGFDDHNATLNETVGGMSDENQDQRGMKGYRELVDTANKIIAEHYGSNTAGNVTEQPTVVETAN